MKAYKQIDWNVSAPKLRSRDRERESQARRKERSKKGRVGYTYPKDPVVLPDVVAAGHTAGGDGRGEGARGVDGGASHGNAHLV